MVKIIVQTVLDKMDKNVDLGFVQKTRRSRRQAR